MVKAKTKTGATWEYVLHVDRDAPEDERTVWTLQRLPNRAFVALADSSDISQDPETGEIKTRIKLGTQNQIALRHGIAGVRNFCDPDTGEEVGLVAGQMVPDSFIERLELAWQRELAAEILRGGGPLSKPDVEKPEPSHTG